MSGKIKWKDIFFGVIYAFYSLRFYDEVAKHWRKRLFLFLFVLVFILMIPLTIRLTINADHFFTATSTDIVNQLPTVTLKDGAITASGKKKQYIHFPGMKKKLVVIDTSDSDINFEEDPAFVWFAKHHVVMKNNKKGMTKYPYPKKSGVYNAERYTMLFSLGKDRFLTAMSIFVFVFGFFALYLFYIIFGILLSSITRMIALLARYKVPYSASMMQAFVGSVPAMMLFVLLYAFNWLSGGTFLACLVVLFIYLSVSVIAYDKLYKHHKLD